MRNTPQLRNILPGLMAISLPSSKSFDEAGPCWICKRKTIVRTDGNGALLETCEHCAPQLLELRRLAQAGRDATLRAAGKCPDCLKAGSELDQLAAQNDGLEMAIRQLHAEKTRLERGLAKSEKARNELQLQSDIERRTEFERDFGLLQSRLSDAGFGVSLEILAGWTQDERRTTAEWLNVIGETVIDGHGAYVAPDVGIPPPTWLASYRVGET